MVLIICNKRSLFYANVVEQNNINKKKKQKKVFKVCIPTRIIHFVSSNIIVNVIHPTPYRNRKVFHRRRRRKNSIKKTSCK